MVFRVVKVRCGRQDYAVINIPYKNMDVPCIIDWKDYSIIKKLDKPWKCNKYGSVSCAYIYNDKPKEVFMHEVVMELKRQEDNNINNHSILHINRIGLDNRRSNLIYNNQQNEKNIKKRKRTVNLPVDSQIYADELPSYVWYMKPDKSHGDRFRVQIGSIRWNSSSSKKKTLRYKLEETKLFIKQLKKDQPELFNNISMNGDFTHNGKILFDEFYKIIHRAGYTNINKYVIKNATKELLKNGYLSKKERSNLNNNNKLNYEQKNKELKNWRQDKNITESDDIKKNKYDELTEYIRNIEKEGSINWDINQFIPSI